MRRWRLGRDFDLKRRERAKTRPEMPAPRIVMFIGVGVAVDGSYVVVVVVVVMMMGGSA